jgi:hypothetical protein
MLPDTLAAIEAGRPEPNKKPADDGRAEMVKRLFGEVPVVEVVP